MKERLRGNGLLILNFQRKLILKTTRLVYGSFVNYFWMQDKVKNNVLDKKEEKGDGLLWLTARVMDSQSRIKVKFIPKDTSRRNKQSTC